LEAVGGFYFRVISDKAGGKIVIVSISCYGLFTLLTGYMPTWWGVVVHRFHWVWFGWVWFPPPALMMEEWPVKTRAISLEFASISYPWVFFRE
jgi:hypothetical protein